MAFFQKIAKKIKNPYLEIRASGNIAKIKRRIGHHQEALEIYKRNLNIALNSNFQNKTIVITLKLKTTVKVFKRNISIKYFKYSKHFNQEIV